MVWRTKIWLKKNGLGDQNLQAQYYWLLGLIFVKLLLSFSKIVPGAHNEKKHPTTGTALVYNGTVLDHIWQWRIPTTVTLSVKIWFTKQLWPSVCNVHIASTWEHQYIFTLRKYPHGFHYVVRLQIRAHLVAAVRPALFYGYNGKLDTPFLLWPA